MYMCDTWVPAQCRTPASKVTGCCTRSCMGFGPIQEHGEP